MTELQDGEVIVDSLFDGIAGKLKWYKKIYYRVLRAADETRYFFKKIYQKFKYGFPLYESWDFKSAHSEWALPRLKYFRANLSGHPSGITLEEWEQILDKIIWSLEHHNDSVRPLYSDDYDHRYARSESDGFITYRPLNETGTVDWSPLEEHSKRVQEGLILFATYYQNLWD
jgi:hypothetical protein